MTLAIDGGEPVRTTPFPKRTPFGEEEIALVSEAINSQNLFYLGGTMVRRLTEEFAKLYGAEYAVACSSGSAAVHIAVGALEVAPGDEVIVPPISDMGTYIGVLYQNCIPVFADLDLETFNLDAASVESRITERTRAVIVVHLFGNPSDMEALRSVASKHNIALIEDASQAHVTGHQGKLLGTFGDIGAFSLQQSKHMTCGEGGMCITNSEEYYERMKLFADKSWDRSGKRVRKYVGLSPNYRMTELQGAVALAQIEKVKQVVERRYRLGSMLNQAIGGCEGTKVQKVLPDSKHGYWLYGFRSTKIPAADFARALSAEGVPASAGYIGKAVYLCSEVFAQRSAYGKSGCPFDCSHTSRAYEYKEGLCPNAELLTKELVIVYLNENFTDADISDVATAIRKVAEGLKEKMPETKE